MIDDVVGQNILFEVNKDELQGMVFGGDSEATLTSPMRELVAESQNG